jgi:CHAT domain-containing protein/tetratricopeptide (TPR) repeat protein
MSMRDRVVTYSRVFARSRAILLACACVCIAASCGGAPADPVEESRDELLLHEDQQRELRKPLAAGTWLVEVREQDIDVRATIEVPGQRAELRESAPRHGVICKVVRLSAPGELRVGVRSDDHPSKRGSVSVRIARFMPADGQAPGAVELGYRAWAAAAEQQVLATPESWTAAADHFNEAIAHFDAAGRDAARGQAAYMLASLQYFERDDWPAAIRAAELAADAFDDADDDTGVHDAIALRGSAELEVAGGMNAGTQRAEQKAMYEAADRRLAGAASYFTQHQLPVRATFVVNMRGVRALAVGADEEAARFFTEAAEMARANQDVAERSKALANLAWVRRLQGFVAEAARQYETLRPLVDPERQPYLYAGLLNNYGFCLIALGDFDRALALHAEALEIFTRKGDQDERATQMAALGALYLRVGDTNRALETLRATIGAQEKLSNTSGLAGTLRMAGNAAATLGQNDLALQYLRRSASIDGNPHNVSRTRVLIAGELRMIGKHQDAEAELGAVLTSSNPAVRADALAERARLRLAQKDLAAAIADLRAADESYARLGLEFSRIDTQASLAQVLLGSNDLAAASKAADESVAIVQRLRANSANPEWRAHFISAQYAPFEARIAVDLAMSAAGDSGALWRAFRTADQVRARSLADQLAIAAPGPGPQDPEEEQLRASLTAQQLRLEARVQRADPDEATTLEVRRDIEETRARLEARRLGRGTAALSNARLPESLREAQQQIPQGALVLAYFVGEHGSHAWLLGRKELRHAALAGRGRLQDAIDTLAEQDPAGAAARTAARELASLVFGRLLDRASEPRLLIIPDGPLNGVPFAALPAAATGPEILIDRFLIGFAPSLALALAAPAREPAAGTRVAVISDPVYAADDKRLPSLGSGAHFRGSRAESHNKLTRLPYSALEARAVADTFGRAETIEISGFDATTSRVLELRGADLMVLHFATHAVARKDSPERSALFLSEYSPTGELLADSQLSAGDIMRSGLRARLVVLSGCATGDGNTLRGEGVLGLTYGFLANGAGSVIASLWPVEDATTARFMREFYRAYRVTGRATEALRTAQLRSRANPAAAAVWSSFVVRSNGFP